MKKIGSPNRFNQPETLTLKVDPTVHPPTLLSLGCYRFFSSLGSLTLDLGPLKVCVPPYTFVANWTLAFSNLFPSNLPPNNRIGWSLVRCSSKTPGIFLLYGVRSIRLNVTNITSVYFSLTTVTRPQRGSSGRGKLSHVSTS